MSGNVAFVRAEFDGRIKLVTATSDLLPNSYQLILTDYEQELLADREKKKCPFKEGDKVLVRDTGTFWRFDKFRFYNEGENYPYVCFSSVYGQCIPLTEHTWKLLGTTDEYKATNNNESH